MPWISICKLRDLLADLFISEFIELLTAFSEKMLDLGTGWPATRATSQFAKF